MRERIKFLSQDEKFLTPIYLDTNRNLHPVSDLVKLDYSYKSTFNRKLFFRDMLLPKNNFGLMRYIYRYNKKLYGTDERKKGSNLIASHTKMQNFELKFLINTGFSTCQIDELMARNLISAYVNFREKPGKNINRKLKTLNVDKLVLGYFLRN